VVLYIFAAQVAKMSGSEYTPRTVEWGPLRVNPGVSVTAFAIIWGLAIWCMVEGEEAAAELGLWKDWVCYYFTWFYIGSQDAWIFFAIYVYWKWGDKKLCKPGDEDDKPEFSDSTYFMMLFTCGVAVGMFFYGVTEPVSYFTDGTTRYMTNQGMTDSEVAQWSITLSVFHWGLHGWVPYCLVGIALGFPAYRHGKQLTMRNTLYTILGKRVDGWVGDCIDILSIVVVVAGVCTSLGLGTQQIAEGLYRLDQDLYDKGSGPDVSDETKDAWTVIIVCITFVAITSVVSGLHYGIKMISITAFFLANFIMLMVFSMDDPVYMLDIAVQSLGHYIQYFFELGFSTDAFVRQKEHGNPGNDFVSPVGNPGYEFPGAPLDVYGLNGAKAEGGSPKFMQWWTIFYWGWWIAWSPFVGLFIARISKGRTIRDIFNYSMTAPLLYIICWFAVFGGAGIKMHNTAMECKNQQAIGFSGLDYAQTVCCPTDTTFRKACELADGKCAGDFRVWQILTVTNEQFPDTSPTFDMCPLLTRADKSAPLLNNGGFNGAEEAAWAEGTYSFKALDSNQTAYAMGASTQRDDSRRVIYQFKYSTANIFEVMEQYYGWGDFLVGVTIVTIVLYFVTSSDSGSLVVDLISAGGHLDSEGKESEPFWGQRILWSLTEGGLAIGLMRAGGTQATGALQAMSIAVGLPYTVILCYMMPAVYRMMLIDDGESTLDDYEWAMPIYGGAFDVLDFVFSFGGLLGGSPKTEDLVESTKQLLIGFFPFVHAFQTLETLDEKQDAKITTIAMTVAIFGLWVLWIVSLILEAASDHGGWFAFAIAVYILMALVMTSIRGKVREAHSIKGNMLEDFCACFLVYPNAGVQYYTQVQQEVTAGGDYAAGDADKNNVYPSIPLEQVVSGGAPAVHQTQI